MHCLDCRIQGKTSTAVGVCDSCGAAVCDRHAHIATRPVRRGPLLGPATNSAGRRVLCPQDAAAEAPMAAPAVTAAEVSPAA